jgi:hypothetical protein
MNMKHQILGLIVVLGAIGVAACESTPEKDAVAEQKVTQEAKDKIAKAEKEAAEKTAKAKKEADEKIAAAAKELAEKKVEVKVDLAQELADIKYQTFVGLRDYKALVASRLDENEKKFIDLKTKGDAKAGTMTADAKKEWAELMKTAEAELTQARTDLKSIEAATETTWSTTKARVDTGLKNFAKSVDTLGKKIQ